MVLQQRPEHHRVAVLEGDDASRSRLLHDAREAGLCAMGFAHASDLAQGVAGGLFDALLLVSDAEGLSVPELVQVLQSYLVPHTPVVLVLEHALLQSVQPFLTSGHHDFVFKPYAGKELMARVCMVLAVEDAAQLRLPVVPPQGLPLAQGPSQRLMVFGAYCFDTFTRTVSLHGEGMPLSGKEFSLALVMFQNPGYLWRRDALCQAAWGHLTLERSRALDTYVSRLRSRLQLLPANGWRLSSVYRHGYRLDTVYAASADSMSAESLAGVSIGA